MIQKLLKNSSLPQKLAIIIRHAERFPITSFASAFDACLTTKGKADAYQFGQVLEQLKSVKLFHSPVTRCKETAECISSGILSANQKATVIGHLLNLGGPYITSPWEGIAPLIERFGHSAFIRKWFNNDFPSDFIMPLDRAAKLQLQVLINQLQTGDASTVNVTHDWNIMLMREFYFNLRHEDIGEPSYLDGLCAYIQDNALRLIYHEHEKVFNLSAQE